MFLIFTFGHFIIGKLFLEKYRAGESFLRDRVMARLFERCLIYHGSHIQTFVHPVFLQLCSPSHWKVPSSRLQVLRSIAYIYMYLTVQPTMSPGVQSTSSSPLGCSPHQQVSLCTAHIYQYPVVQPTSTSTLGYSPQL